MKAVGKRQRHGPSARGGEGRLPELQRSLADERDPHSLGGLKAITGQLMLCYHADFQLIFGCTVLVEGPLEHQTLHYGTTHCNT